MGDHCSYVILYVVLGCIMDQIGDPSSHSPSYISVVTSLDTIRSGLE